MEVIYVRGVVREDVDAKKRACLERFPRAKGIVEDVGASSAHLDQLLATASRNTVIIVPSLAVFGKEIRDLVRFLDGLSRKGLLLVSLKEGLDTKTPAGASFVKFMRCLREVEKEVLSARGIVRIDALRAAGRRVGRPPKIQTEQKVQIVSLRGQGLCLREIAQAVGVAYGTVRSVLAASLPTPAA